jgi:hypothetical protein
MMVALVSLSLWATVAAGRTWMVRQDGSGDFHVIQNAVDAASDGDVIDIGPGRWDDYQLIWYDGAPAWDAYVFIDGKSLTLQGAGTDQTILGPEDEDFHPWPGRHVFIVMGINCGELKIFDMTLEHSPWEIVGYSAWNQRFEMARCVVREGNRGVIVACPSGGSVTDSEFIDLDDYGVHTTNPTNEFLVRNCTFSNVYVAAGADWSPSHLDVLDCEMEGGVGGVGFFGGATGSVTNCTMRNSINYGIAISDPGAVTITDNVIEQTTGWGMSLGDADQAVITNNVIRTETGGCLFLPYPCDSMVFASNDLDRGDGDFVRTSDYWPYTPPVYFHLENNYWGTTDADEIQAHIIDGHVQDRVNMFVIFEPFAGGPVPTEIRSWSTVKELFRGR